MNCTRCGGEHQSAGCKRSLVFQGYVFAPPYLCMCCGDQIPPRRWLMYHTCVSCEWGECQHPNPKHPRPLWLETTDGTAAFESYVEYVEAVPRSRY